MQRATRPALALAALLVVGGCSDSTAPVTPLPRAQPLVVQMTSTEGVSTEGLPRVAITGAPGGVHVVLGVSGICAMDAQATAGWVGNRVQVWVTRTANALADCIPAAVGYEYDIQAAGLGAGAYEVSVVDQMGEQTPRLIGRATVSVTPVP